MLNALKIFVYILTYSELTPLVANFLREAIYRNIKLFLLFTCGEASRSRSSKFIFSLSLLLFFLKSSQLVAIRAIINIKAIIVEVPDLDSDQCDQL